MNKRAAVLLVFTLTASIFAVLPVQVKATSRTIVVPDDYPTIQAAALGANDTDTIFVKSGNYTESVDVNKSISLVGEERNTVVITAPSSGIFSGQTPIKVFADNVRISNLTINNYNYLGFGISTIGNGTQITNNTVYAETAISTSAAFTTVSRNNLSGSTSVLVSSHDCNVIDNVLSSSVDLEGSFNLVSGNRITGNTVHGIAGYGVFINGNSNNVKNNTITDEQDGISVFIGSNNAGTANLITNCTDTGLRIDQGSSNTFLKNNVTGCKYGAGMGLEANNNTIYHNNFVNNVQQAFIQPNVSEYWDNGSEGNYWNDYSERYPNAKEVDNSGVWNTPYVIEANNTDNYPLVLPIGASPKQEQPPFPLLLAFAFSLAVAAVVAVAALVYWKKRKR